MTGSTTTQPAAKPQIEAIYPLSPMQQGLVFHSLLAPESGVYTSQIAFRLRGDLDVGAFQHAWREVARRHAVLRTLFAMDEGSEPLQIVLKDVALPWHNEDWRGVAPDEQERRLATYLREDRERGFSLESPPLMRLALVRLADGLHEFIWTIHHALIDGWSTPLVVGEVLELYTSCCASRAATLAPAHPYGSFIEWMRRQDSAAARDYWQRTLEGVDGPTALPFDRCSAPEEVLSCETRLSKDATAALEAITRQHRVTMGTIIHGAWALLLSRYCGTDDVVYGATQSGRPATLPGVESMVGLFINTLPSRVRVDADAELIPWLQRLQVDQVESRAFDYASLADVQRWSQLPPGEALFDTLIVFENYPWPRRAGGEDAQSALSIERTQASYSTNYAVTMLAKPGEQLGIQFLTDGRTVGRKVAQRMIDHYLRILETIAANPRRRLREIDLLDEAERRALLTDWAGETSDTPHEATIPELFEAQAARTPGAVAVSFGERQLSYGELNARANQLARHLRTLGVGRATMVGVCLERSLEMVVGLLGVLKAGGTYVPLDPSYPGRRLDLMVQDTAPPVLLTNVPLVAKLPDYQGTVVRLDDDGPAIPKSPDGNLEPLTSSDDLAYVMYTSGSTGSPKGVCVPHRGVVRLVRSTNYVDLGRDEVLLQFAPISFDASTLEIWGALLNGARLVVMPPTIPTLEELGLAIEAHGITTLWLTAAMFHQMVDGQLPRLVQVRQLLAGGETLSPSHVERALAAMSSDQRLINGYGPTENTTFTCCHVMSAGTEIDGSVPIGEPVAATRVYILDARLEPVPIGVPGELYTGGDGVARGYLNDPALTAQKFLPDPFRAQQRAGGGRMYRSGDLARWTAGGVIEFLGRRDHQVKLRGFRIELGEIESALLACDEIKSAVVLCREDTPGDKRLVAYIVAADGALSVDDVRRQLLETVPQHMVPSAFVVLDSLPLSANGKVERRALPMPESAAPSGAPVVPSTPTEHALAAIWSDTLRLQHVSVRENFFELGGHSLIAMRVASRIREDLGVELPLKCLFDHPTIAELAATIETLQATRMPAPSPGGDREEIEL